MIDELIEALMIYITDFLIIVFVSAVVGFALGLLGVF